MRISAAALRHNLERGVAAALMAEVGDDVAGVAFYSFMHFSLSGEHVYLDDLFVAPEHRDRGLGRHLMAALAERASARGCAGITWMVEADNDAGVRFYRRLGASMSESRRVMSVTDLASVARVG